MTTKTSWTRIAWRSEPVPEHGWAHLMQPVAVSRWAGCFEEDTTPKGWFCGSKQDFVGCTVLVQTG